MRRPMFAFALAAASLCLTLGGGTFTPTAAYAGDTGAKADKTAKVEKEGKTRLDSAKALPIAAAIGEAAPDFTLTSAAGTEHSLKEFKGKYVVLEWVNYDCPFVVAQYGAGRMQALQTALTEQGVVWLSICSSGPGKQGYFEGAALTERIAKEGSKATAYLIDAKGKVGKAYGARTTPHMYVIDPEGVLIYAGGLDDTPARSKDAVKEGPTYVETALTEAQNGGNISKPTSTPYGCSVHYATAT